MKSIILVVMLVFKIFANDASYNKGEMLFFSKGCSGCHGASAEGSSTYPKLANKEESFIIKKLTNFKAGKADSVSQQMMAQFAQKLNTKDIKNLAYFLSHYKEVKVEDVGDDLLGGFGS
jgi:cytochrome c553